MGVYINMEMPECKSKPYDVPYIYHVIGDIICYPNGEAKLRILIDKTEHEYTLVPVPPHGRLGDIDKLIERLERQVDLHEKQAKRAEEKGTAGYTNDMYIVDRNRDLIGILKALSVVIPAEKAEKSEKAEKA